MFRSLLIFMLFLGCSTFGHAQEDPWKSNEENFDLYWGELERSSGSLLDILPRKSTSFYTLRWSGGRAIGTYRITNHEDFRLKDQARIKQVAQTGIANFETAKLIEDQLYVFLSDKANGEMLLYAQPYDEEMNIYLESKLIASYTNNRIGAKPNFSIQCSENKKFFAVFWQTQGRDELQDGYGYVILDAKLQVLQSGSYFLPFDGNLSTINQHHITDNGDYFISVTEHNTPNDRLFFNRSFENFKAIHVYKIKNNELNEFSLDLNRKRVDDMEMSSVNNIFTLSGIYGSGRNGKIDGVFVLRYDTQQDSVLFKGLVPFDPNLIDQNWAPSNARRSRFTNRNIAQTTYRFKTRDFFSLNDGTICGSLEKYYVSERTNYDSRTGLSSTIYQYYYDDIYAFKIGKEGRFDWQIEIPKSQVSTNDGGPFSSYSSFTDGDNMYLIFNDNLKNYDDFGHYSRGNNPCHSFNLSRRKNTAAICSVNLKNGNIERKILFTRKDLNSIVVPKMFKLDIPNKELLLYALMSGKEKFGILNYGQK